MITKSNSNMPKVEKLNTTTFVCNFDGIGFGIINGHPYTVQQFDTVKSVITWAEHNLVLLESLATGLRIFLKYVNKKGIYTNEAK